MTTADSRASGRAQRYAKVRKGMHLRFVRYAVNPLVFCDGDIELWLFSDGSIPLRVATRRKVEWLMDQYAEAVM